jgi:DNA-directed RNA polymerase specialized sigma24 family protein
MNRTPIAERESRVNEGHAQFLAVYPVARRAAEVRTCAAVARTTVARADRENLEQEALLAVWRALPHYNPSRASLRTFVERVAANRIASLLRSLHNSGRFREVPLERASAAAAADGGN